MHRLLLGISLAVCIGIALFAHAAAQDARQETVKAPVAKQKSDQIIDILRQPADVRGLRETLKLKDALEYLNNQFVNKVPFVVDREAFLAELGADAPDPLEEEVSLLSSGKLPTAEVLRYLLVQVGKGHATFVIRRKHIEITTRQHSTTSAALHRASVTVEFEAQPLKQVLRSLSDDTGVDINLDPQVAAKADVAITARFRNASLESTLLTVTEMAGLKFVPLANCIYVTTSEQAKLLHKEEAERAKRRSEMETVLQGKRLEAAP